MDSKNSFIKEYNHWTLHLHENQCYLGRTYLWAKRKDALDFFDMIKEEQKEFFAIGKAWKKTMDHLFKPGWYNYAALGNVNAHLHLHCIPRYTSQRNFESM